MEAYQQVYHLQQQHRDVETYYGTLKYIAFGSRYGYYLKPFDNCQKLLLFYHGSRGTALGKALIDTKLLKYAKKYNCIIFFGQADGLLEGPTIHPVFNNIGFGEVYWGIKESQNLLADIEYTQQVIDHFQVPNVYYLGHSNGGVFALLLTVYLPNAFKAIISHKGGMGYDPHFYVDFDRLTDTDRRTPILFVTSEHDIHRPVCEQAHDMFMNMDFPSELVMIPKDGHVYNSEYEAMMLQWLMKF